MTWPLFLIEPTATARVTLRRFTLGAAGTCPLDPLREHDARAVIAEAEPWPLDGTNGYGADDWPHADPNWPPASRWPLACACGYVFADTDQWQRNVNRLYAGGGWTGVLGWTETPAGALWEAPWMPGVWQGPDGRCLVVRLPDGTDWLIDGPASNGAGWERTGDPPLLTARPSIASPGYHGWLTEGVLSDDLEGRTYG